MTLHDGRPARSDHGALALAVVVLVAFVTAALPLAEALPIGERSLAAVVALCLLCVPLLVGLVYSVVKLARVPELRTLNRRRDELRLGLADPPWS